MNKTILIIDDEINILRSLDMILSSEGFTILKAGSLKDAWKIIGENEIPLFLVDVILPDGNGIEFIKQIRQKQSEAVIIMISGHASIKMAIEATKKGADDFLEKPLSRDKLLLTLNNFIKRLDVERKYSELQRETQGIDLIGVSTVIQDLISQVDKVASTNSKVLITGESGTGKEIIAHMIHFKSQRVNKPFVKINCAAIPDELIEAELFGVEKGAFTGASERREGKFKEADGGTLFMDEIGDMSLKTQTKVLRVLQEGDFERVGSSNTLQTDVRIVAATNQNLPESVGEGKFREDLYFRLNVLPLHIAPLRERLEDVPLLIEFFLNKFSEENNRQKIGISNPALKILNSYAWPGNVRELKNVIERLVIMSDGDLIDTQHLPDHLLRPDINVNQAYLSHTSLKEIREKFESAYIKFCLEKLDGNVTKAAELLGVDRTYLYKKLKKINMKV